MLTPLVWNGSAEIDHGFERSDFVLKLLPSFTG
jgi:hypothetical protein